MKANVSAAPAIAEDRPPRYTTVKERSLLLWGEGLSLAVLLLSVLFRRGRRVCLADINIDFHVGIFLQ